MKNLLFWLYVVIALALIAFGYIYWQQKVTDSAAANNVSTQSVSKKAPKKQAAAKSAGSLFKDDAFQQLYNKKTKDGGKMTITLVATPYQTSEHNTSVKDDLEKAADKQLAINAVEVSGASTAASLAAAYEKKPDLILLDALTINDYYENIPVNAHLAALETMYNDAVEQHDIPVVIIGTRPIYNDPAFADYQQAEADYLSNKDNNFNYVSQAGEWPTDDSITDDYNTASALLTSRGIKRWSTAITDHLFNK
ncbi:hypothetical protein [Macrococcus equipercicus]|uniref:SGNH/GDSL hydrolase family protein n=1 Tax=Macrococcus equipercicus TaxID=69967 RepID=A0A9Q9BSY6_9STAP|nr:hypothetical protein [Macrococcus equipercicus]UTH13416.1 hypothetical protein KFV11_09295 [Macrococcus equipercicus]